VSSSVPGNSSARVTVHLAAHECAATLTRGLTTDIGLYVMLNTIAEATK